MKVLLDRVSQRREEWLEARKKLIGASEAYDAADIDDESRPLKPWLKLRGEEEEFTENKSTHFGNQLENFVAEEFCREYVKDHPGAEVTLMNPDVLVRHPSHAFAGATFDRFVTINGELCPLELKTTKAMFAPAWADGGVPKRYRVQNLQQIACLEEERVTRGFIACFIFEPDFVYREILRDEEILDELFRREGQLVKMAQEGVVPALKTPTPFELRALFWKGSEKGTLVEMTPELEMLACAYRVAANSKDTAEAQQKKLQAIIMQKMGTGYKAECPGYSITMVKSETPDLDTKKLREADPKTYDLLMQTYGRKIKKMYPLVKERKGGMEAEEGEAAKS